MAEGKLSRYAQLIEEIFKTRYKAGADRIEFKRTDLVEAAKKLKIELPLNLGDVIYSIRYRTKMPPSVLKNQPAGKEWIIQPDGRSEYAFCLIKEIKIVPNNALVTIKIPDSTPEIVSKYSMNDEQSLLAKVRYNRLIDIFLGITTYSLQNHLRTTVDSVGQVEIDELYVGVDSRGCQYILPVQAKGGSDKLSPVQTGQDLDFCASKFPALVCRAISTQFIDDGRIAMFELRRDGDEVRLVQEKHYRLVPAKEITPEELKKYGVGRPT